MGMMRKIRRSVAKYHMKKEGYSYFGMYTTLEEPVRVGKTDKYKTQDVNKSLFSKAWRDYA